MVRLFINRTYICLPHIWHVGLAVQASWTLDVVGPKSRSAPHPEFQIIGVNCGLNLQYCRQSYRFGTWLEYDVRNH